MVQNLQEHNRYMSYFECVNILHVALDSRTVDTFFKTIACIL